MREDEIILTPGSHEEESWFPAVALAHGATRSELYVIVGETVEGMAEDVPEASWLDIHRRFGEPQARIERLRAALIEAGRALNAVGRLDEAQAVLDVLNEEAP